MSNPTSNFGWQMPEPTDLVTDLPADFEVFGQAVDTDFVDLLGGTTGQILSKTSATDLDFTWVSPNPGDITGVTAGTGISGGGTSGDVTVTNDMATTITAAGDIVVGTGSGTYDNLPIGTTAQVLTADTTVSPYKVKWATPASAATFVGCSLNSSTDQTISNNTLTAVTWNQEDFDTDNFHDNSSNTSRITIPEGKGGKYQVNAFAQWDANATGDREIQIYKNGVSVKKTELIPSASVFPSSTIMMIISLVATDYIELFCFQLAGTTQTLYKSGVSGHFSVGYLGA